MVVYILPVLYWKYPLRVNSVQTFKTLCLRRKFLPRLISIYQVPWQFLYCFVEKQLILGKFRQENQNYLLMLKLVVMFISDAIHGKYLFFDQFGSKIWIVSLRWNSWTGIWISPIFLGQITAKSQRCLLKMKLGPLEFLDCAEFCSIITFPVLNWKYPFWGNLV